MASNSNFPCPNCHRWFTNQKSFWHHIRACHRAIETKTSAGIATIAANPLLSIANTSIAPNHHLHYNQMLMIINLKKKYRTTIWITFEVHLKMQMDQIKMKMDLIIPSRNVHSNHRKGNQSQQIILTSCYMIFF